MKNRRAISTVVGMVFFVIAMTVAISYISYSMNTLDQFAQTVMVKSSLNQDRENEDLQITKATIDGNKFNLTIMNEGTVPIHLNRLWVTNQTDNTIFKRDLDLHIKPSEQEIKVGQSVDLYANTDSKYALKVVTSRGTSSEFFLSSDVDTQIQLITPAQIAPNVKFMITTIISNNSTYPNNINDLTPTMTIEAGSPILSEDFIPSDIESLPRGQTGIFTQIYTAPATQETLTFNASYTGAPTGSWDIANVDVKEVEIGSASSAEWSEAVRRVGILISGIPNPNNGEAGDISKFGMGVINPLDRDVDVFSIAISSPTAKLFEEDPTGVEPSPQNQWDSFTEHADSSIIFWESPSTPVTVAAGDIGQFRWTQRIKGENIRETNIIIEALTSEGKFSQLNTMSADNSFPSMNLYYTDVAADPTNNWTFIMKNLPGGVERKFNATLENTSGTSMNSRAKLVIVVPSDFTNVQDIGGTGWETATILTNPDNSHKIEVETSSNFGSNNAKVYQFKATPAIVSSSTLYVLQTTSYYPDNWVSGIKIIAGISEAAVQIVP